ncbi:MAG: MFS transporter [Candidatus Saccharicenans sp.]
MAGESSLKIQSFEARMAGRLTLASSAGMFIFGIVMAILGAILPELFRGLKLEKVQAGNLFFFMNLGMLASTLIFGPVVDRFGFKFVLVLSSLLVGISFAWLALAQNYSVVLAAVVFLGLAGGALNGGSNALVNDLNPEKRAAALNFLGIFFGFGALFIPLVIGSFLSQTGLKTLILIPAVLSVVPFLLFLALKFPEAKQEQGFPFKDLKKVVGHSLLWLGAFTLFFQSGNEFSVGGWLSSFFQEKFNFGASRAALVLSGYWAFLMLGRFLVSRLPLKIKRENLIMLSAGLSAVAVAGLIFWPSSAVAVFLALLIGLGFAAIYPTTLAIIGEAFSELSGTAFSVAISTGLLGGMLCPWLIGRISQVRSVKTGLLVPLVNLVLIMVLQLLIGKKLKAESRQVNQGKQFGFK